MAQVTAIRDLNMLDSQRLRWHAKLAEVENCSVYQSFDWYRWSVTQFFPESRITVLRVDSGDQLLGYLPLLVMPRESRFGTTQVLTNHSGIENGFFRPIGRNTTAILLTAANYLKRHSLWWDVVELHGIELNGWDHGRTIDSFGNAGIRLSQSNAAKVAVVKLNSEQVSETANSEADKFETKHFRASHRFGSELEYAQEADESLMTELLSEFPFESLKTATQSKLDLLGGSPKFHGHQLAAEYSKAHLHQIHQFAMQRDCYDVCVVFQNGKKVGFVYHLTFGGRTTRIAWGIQTDLVRQEEQDSLKRALTQAAVANSQAFGDTIYESSLPILAEEFESEQVRERISYRGESVSAPWAKLARLLRRRGDRNAS